MNGDIDAPQHEQPVGDASVSAKLLPAQYNVEQMLRFVIGIDSQFYPQLRRLYRRRRIDLYLHQQALDTSTPLTHPDNARRA